MIITYHGAACFKVQFGDITLAFNPISKESAAYKPVRFGADAALISTEHPDFNGVEQVSYGERQPFIARGPGEYEVSGVVIRGYLSESEYDLSSQAGGKKRHNTIYVVKLEGMTLCYLGALSEREIPQEAREALENIDILFVPIGGNGVLDASSAYKLTVALEPRIIIPMLYDAAGKNGDGITTFLEEGGREKVSSVDKLTVKQKDVATKEGEIVVLAAQ
ncbi:MAG: MBL fold metallo-hydrolase [Candidatus Paceibacterota bacterium]